MRPDSRPKTQDRSDPACAPRRLADVVEYYATDHLGSIRVVFDPNGTVLARSDYLPFGEAYAQSGALPRQRFTGQEHDDETGLEYFNARSLLARTGRFNRPDPLLAGAMGNPQGWNRYAYVGNNPMGYTDPTGMMLAPGLKILPDIIEWVQAPLPPPSTPLSYGNEYRTADGFTEWWVKQPGVFFEPDSGSAAPFSEANCPSCTPQSGPQSAGPSIVFSVGTGQLTVTDGKTTQSFSATSGKGECINNPACEGRKNQGPIPAGRYELRLSELSDPNFIGDFARTFLGSFPSMADWGDWRVPLHPVGGTNTHGRDGFYLHGGMVPGSAGCIDVGGGLFGSSTTNQLLSALRGSSASSIYVVVK